MGSHSSFVSEVPKNVHRPFGASVTFIFVEKSEGISVTERIIFFGADELKHLGYY